MTKRLFDNRRNTFYLLLAVVLFLSIGCNSTKHLSDKELLLRKTRVTIKSEKKVYNKGEIKDNLTRYILQKPNSYFLFPGTTVKLSLYNRHYNRLHSLMDDSLPKSVERPIIYDSAKTSRSVQNMKQYLYYLGYFYAKVKDTCIISHKKAYVTYAIDLGLNYRIDNVKYNVDDSSIARIVMANSDGTALMKGKEFSYSMIDEERSRLTSIIRNNGYYKFTQDNINYITGLDTVDKTIFKDIESPFENAVNFISTPKVRRDHKINITGTIQLADDNDAYNKYTIGSVHVFPDYTSIADLKDSSLIKKTIDSVEFRYHKDYVHAGVLYDHIYLNPGNSYSQQDDDKTKSKLNELGIFQYIKVEYHERPDNKNLLDCNIFLSRAKKLDLTTHYEISSGSTYSLGNSVGINYRAKNFAKGANLLTIGVNGGVELGYNSGGAFIQNFSILTKYYGVNANIDFPKFIAPIPSLWFGSSNLPHTIIGGGENVIDRVNYFTLVNTSANFSYNWRETSTNTWSFSPVFVNIIQVPKKSESFQQVLDSNAYLRNSYKENFIEGENVSFTFDNILKKHGVNYSYLKLSLEEAGGLLGLINQLGTDLNSVYKIQYAQYTKFDFDGRHYITFPKSVLAFRFYGGIGIPYGQSDALPYIKQYFAGGPYSLRGWRIRTLGPGSSYDAVSNANQIDRTGDIKLEMNAEYRFPITPLFAGAVKMNGAIFADAGNIWLAKKDPDYPGGEFQFNTFGQDIAVDMGVGTRFDIASFLTLRIDVAVPVKKPYVFTNGGWVFNDIDPQSGSWRANNIIFNVSIGYPF